ncbi:uncharacterized protein [Epargyreus clarus]|uniref:uncharacterized protein n=1 Tax=Epargyreus clarus TaxID=520877 RepID=UPI003C2FF3A1
MSFITKRERVFTEYDIFDLPPRNEGKLKAYASCTDARAWSHFCSDKSEHLVEIIKRNNETCRPKYVPTDAIVNTLMAAKNAEIGRLKRKIESFEQMLAAYDQLELTCDQKCEIANAHAAIKAANKELDDLCLDLDLSGFTEGIDSEAFETGKSRGDEVNTAHEVTRTKGSEWEFEKASSRVLESKANQTGPSHTPRDASTSARDSRIDDLQDVIITKDAKLSAMQNTIAVMENDICEPYCIYAHIYTALEKIFGILCQNEKYKEYLDLLTAGKDTRAIDVKGKILFKLKVLEKFSTALIAPCSQEQPSQSKVDCSCYRAEVIAHVETTFALTSPTRNTNLDSKRALLVADIMENQEIKEILSKNSISSKADEDQVDESFGIDSYSIETENLHRLKNLQANYEDLLNCYENLKYEKNCLVLKCKNYDELEKEFQCLKSRLNEYNLLWNEKEHYRKRSEDLDSLKEKFLILSEETLNIETQLKAEQEINRIKSKAVDELRYENIGLEKKVNDMGISFEKEKNILTCKLKECECKIMCQEQQIKSLSIQIDQLLEQDRVPSNIDSTKTLELTDQIESLNQQIKNLKNALICDDEEKQQLQDEFTKKLELINELKMDIEDQKSHYENTIRNQHIYLEKYTKKYQDEIQMLKEENKSLSKEIRVKSGDIDKFISIINNKSQEINELMEELEHRKDENRELYLQLQNTTESLDKNISTLENEKKNALFSLQLARTDSQKLIEHYEEPHSHLYQHDDGNNSNRRDIEDNERCLMNIVDHDNENSLLLQEIQQLRADNITNISKLQDENTQNKKSLEVLRKESVVLKHKLLHLETLSQQFHNLQESHDRLLADKIRLEKELQNKTCELNNIIHLTRRESETLMDRLQQSESVQQQLNDNYEEVVSDRYTLLSDLSHKDAQLQILSDSLNDIKKENERLRQESQRVYNLEQEFINLNNAYEHLIVEKNMLQNDFDNKTKEIDNLYNNLENKIEENRELHNQIKNLQYRDVSNKNSIADLQNEKINFQTNLDTMRKESVELIDKIKYYESLSDLEELKLAYNEVKSENNKLQNDIEIQTINFKILQDKNKELNNHSQNLLTHNEELEKALIEARNKHLSNPDKSSPEELLNIRKEIENMKQEKNMNHQKIKNLLDKLDESEYTISKLTEDIMARDDKISLLENHINELQDEVRRLHTTLDELTESSEEIKDYSLQNIDQSLKRMEAHHSKATHNMRVELAKLQNRSNMLENQLSVTKLKSEESIRSMNKYITEITHLQNEREAVVKNIKELEIKSIGDSILSPTNCTVEDILSSISKIMKYLESRELKNTSLEKTLLKVQSSFQLVLDKADEEKKTVDIEKQKLINEKEAAVLDLQNMEKTLMELKHKYEEDISQDRRIINDLEAEISNQNLIIDKINKSKADYISKLEEEIQSLRKMYETSISRVGELQATIQSNFMDNQKKMALIEEANLSLREKCEEVESLKDKLQTLLNKSVQSVSTEVKIPMHEYGDQSTQTNKEYWDENIIETISSETIQKIEHDDNNLNIKVTKKSKDKVISEILPTNEPYSLNEVQILRANIDMLPLDGTNNAYRNYKMKRLNYGPMEKCSISSVSNGQDSSIEKISKDPNNVISGSDLRKPLKQRDKAETSNIIDVYNLQPVYLSSSQKIPSTKEETHRIEPIKKSKILINQSKSSSLCDLKNDRNHVENVKKHKSDKDLFVIYKDSSSNITSQTNHKLEILELYNKDQLQNNNNINITETSQNKKKKRSKNKSNSQIIEDQNINETNNNKPKLQIELPRIVPESSSIITTSDGDNKSLDSYTYAIYSSPKRTYSDTNIKNKQDSSNIPLHGSPDTLDKLSHEEKIHDIFFNNQSNGRNRVESNDQLSNKFDASLSRLGSDQPSAENDNNITPKRTKLRRDSHHKLSRVGANVLLVEYSDEKCSNDTTSSQHTNDSQETLKSENFGLQYILDTMKCENNPQNFALYNKLKTVPRSKNNSSKNRNQLEPLKSFDNFPETEMTSNSNDIHEVGKGHQKSFSDFGVLVKMDSVYDYENKIRHLSKALENIEKDYKKKIDAVKVQYDSNIKNIINEHNQGVKSIQGLHEETLQDVIKIHENEVENLRTMSIEALRKVEKLEKENHTLKNKIYENPPVAYDEEPVKISTPEIKKRRGRSRLDTKMLSKTNVEAFNVKPKTKSHGPCTCSLDMNISDTIRNIFEQVDAEQRKVAENAYLKYIANKISNNNIEALDAQELSFLHLKVCRTWKTKLSKEEALQKRIDSLEIELLNKQRQAQQHMAELDRKVAEERRRLQEVREAVCRNTPDGSRDVSPEPIMPQANPTTTCDKNICSCNPVGCNTSVGGRGSAGDLGVALSGVSKTKRTKVETNRDEKINGSRCVSPNLAPENWCSSPENPKSKQHPLIEVDFNSDLNKQIVQIKPQRIKMAIRAGDTLDFKFYVKPAVNYPVDLYFLLDASKTMGDVREKVYNETEKIVEAINEITQDVQLGLGFFVDKNLPPFTMKKDSDKTYSFKHLKTLSKDHTKFRNLLNDTPFGYNYDAPEAGLDALAQAIVCKDKIGWRGESRKIILYVANGPYHVVGDGKWAGLVNPYDGECYTFDDNLYKNEAIMDYPSPSIINKLASDAEISIVFLIERVQAVYNFLARDLGARIVELKGKKSDIPKILKQEYEKITQSLQFKVYLQGNVVSNKIKLSFAPDCYVNIDKKLCTVKLGEQKDIVGKITVPEYIEGNVIVEIAIKGIKERLILDLEVISECSCTKENDNPCKGGAIRRCGVCECPPNRYGDLCSCDSTNSTIKDETTCKAPNSNLICNGRASCLCGTCICEGRYRGAYCECDNMGCPSDENGMCGGHGTCECGNCICYDGWSWSSEASRSKVCNCYEHTENCQSNSNICFDYGECKCGHCKCSSMCEWDARSSYDEVCRPLACSGTAKECHERQCNLLKPFAFGRGNGNSLCKDRVNVTSVSSLAHLNLTDWHVCSNVRADVGCYTNYTYRYDELSYGINLIIQTKRDCADSYFIYGGACLGALIAIGLFTIVIWKLFTMHRDRMEYKRFVKEQGLQTSVSINPHYESASTTYINPSFQSHQ